MNTTAFWRLTWKEYRAIRTFWLSIVGLVVLLSWLFVLTQERTTAVNLVFNFALGAPAFFAIGCAGAAFAGEKEEGTFEFLRVSPVSAGQILASKLALTFVATLAMFAVLWPLALWATGAHLPEPTQLPGMLGLWLIGALEAIAWGMFFSLLGARPLLAVVLAMAAASTLAHGVSWQFRETHNYGFEWMSYIRSAPWRALVALVVLGVDIYLGRNWLDGGMGPRRAVRRDLAKGAIAIESGDNDSIAAPTLLAQRDRSTMFGHLLWQQWRQAKWLVLLMLVFGLPAAGMGVGILQTMTHIAPEDRSGVSDTVIRLVLSTWASLLGTFVFLVDQERRQYSFFAEHNVPPRLVWLTRHAFWFGALVVGTAVVFCFWLTTYGTLWKLSELVRYGADWRNNPWYGFSPILEVPPLGLALACALAAYAAGQWVSMFVRSGVMAGFLGLILSAVLIGWIALMHTMQLGFWWSVLPVSIVLLWASWLRAPDWIAENRRRRARVKAAASVLAPAVALLVVVPIWRVHQIPAVWPGFDMSGFELALQEQVNAGKATVDLYRKASSLYEQHEIAHGWSMAEDWESMEISGETRRPPPQSELDWLTENKDVIALLLEAGRAAPADFFDAAHATQLAKPVLGEHGMIALLLTSGRELESQGRMDEALDRYFLAIKVASDFAAADPWVENWQKGYFPFGFDSAEVADSASALAQITRWAAQPGQTPDRVRAALKRVRDINSDVLRLDDRVKSNYVLVHRCLSGDKDAKEIFYGHIYGGAATSPLVWSMLMPWENSRALRLLDQVTNIALWRLSDLRRVLDFQGTAGAYGPQHTPANKELELGGLLDDDHPGWSNWFDLYFEDHKAGRQRVYPYQEVGGDVTPWLESTFPSLSRVSQFDIQLARDMVQFEARKRGTMLVLALEAYRLEHGKLPNSLTEVMNADIDRWLLDPYSGLEFRYFPSGIPDPEHSEDIGRQFQEQSGTWPKIVPSQPGIWCTGPELIAYEEDVHRYDEATGTEGYVTVWSYRFHRDWTYFNGWAVWSHGFWFPIPEERK